MPPQGLDLNEYGIESGVTAPQARNFAFLDHKGVKISLFFFHFIFTRDLPRLSFGRFGGVKRHVAPPPSRPLGGAWPDWPPLDPPVEW